MFDCRRAVDENSSGSGLASSPMYPVQFLFVLVLGGGQEELGWRGVALPRLQAACGGTVASLVIGVVWAVWHLPLFAIPASSQYGQAFLPYAVAVLASSVVLTWLFNATGGSVLLAMVFHASVNASSSLWQCGRSHSCSSVATATRSTRAGRPGRSDEHTATLSQAGRRATTPERQPRAHPRGSRRRSPPPAVGCRFRTAGRSRTRTTRTS